MHLRGVYGQALMRQLTKNPMKPLTSLLLSCFNRQARECQCHVVVGSVLRTLPSGPCGSPMKMSALNSPVKMSAPLPGEWGRHDHLDATCAAATARPQCPRTGRAHGGRFRTVWSFGRNNAFARSWSTATNPMARPERLEPMTFGSGVRGSRCPTGVATRLRSRSCLDLGRRYSWRVEMLSPEDLEVPLWEVRTEVRTNR
jgi:hypothetical protein